MICVVGEALVDVFPDGPEREVVGGSPLNLAVALSLLDVPVQLVTQAADDDRGRLIREHLARNGVDAVVAPAERTATATVALAADGTAAYAFDLAWSLPQHELPACDALHVGSLGAVVEPGRDTVLDLVEQAWERDVFVSYDPNLRPDFISDPEQVWLDVEALAERATLVKLSTEDVGLLHPGADPEDIARSLLSGDRTELVLLTEGAEGATAFAAGRQVHLPAPPTEVVDTVGAGDSFMAAALAILLEDSSMGAHGSGMPRKDDQLARLLRGAMTAAAITCSRRGADPPHRSELPPGWPD